MRQGVSELAQFYASPLGAAARRLIARKIAEAWPDPTGLDILGVGYATPFMTGLEGARRAVAVMPAAQGAEAWPRGGANRVCLGDDGALPVKSALFDRVLAVHALEESGDPAALLDEIKRVMAPAGRAILVVAARHGAWSDAETSAFGHGRPFSRRQLERLVRAAELSPVGWTRALYLPPLPAFARYADAFEQAGSRLWPAFAGVVLIEAVKQTLAVRPAYALPVRRRPARGVLAPRPAGAGA
jgi:SAM-dependent methyltransferase